MLCASRNRGTQDLKYVAILQALKYMKFFNWSISSGQGLVILSVTVCTQKVEFFDGYKKRVDEPWLGWGEIETTQVVPVEDAHFWPGSDKLACFQNGCDWL